MWNVVAFKRSDSEHCGFTIKSCAYGATWLFRIGAYIHKRHLEMLSNSYNRLKWNVYGREWERERNQESEKRRKRNKYSDAALGNVCLFSLPSLLDDSQLQNALVYMIRCIFSLRMLCAIYGNYYRIFFAKRQHRHCTMHTNSITTKVQIGMLKTEFSVQCKQHCRIKLFARNKKKWR